MKEKGVESENRQERKRGEREKSGEYLLKTKEERKERKKEGRKKERRRGQGKKGQKKEETISQDRATKKANRFHIFWGRRAALSLPPGHQPYLNTLQLCFTSSGHGSLQGCCGPWMKKFHLFILCHVVDTLWARRTLWGQLSPCFLMLAPDLQIKGQCLPTLLVCLKIHRGAPQTPAYLARPKWPH